MASDFAPLRVHTEYGRGGSSIKEYITLAKLWGYRGIGIVDDNFYGVNELFLHSEEEGVKPIIGAEMDGLIIFVKDRRGFENYSRFLSGVKAGLEGLCVVVFDIDRYRYLKEKEIDVYFGIETPEFFIPEGVKPVAVPPIYYASAEDVFLYSMLSAIRKGSIYQVKDTGREMPTPQKISRFPENSLKNTLEILEKCNFNPFSGKFLMPHLNEDFICPDVNGMDSKRRERLLKEISIIREKGFEGYFLMVKKITDYARSNRIMVNVRGSGAGSLLLHLYGASVVDPVKYRIPFERFLNRARSDPPDIDIDVDYRERERIVEFIKRTFKNTAHISTINRFELRGAIRAVSRAMGVPPSMAGDHLREDILKWAERITGKPSHISTHASGIVVSPVPIVNVVPLKKGNKGIMVQAEKEAVEHLGLLKLDILGVRGVGALVHLNKNIPDSDRQVFDYIGRGKTIGAFQIESPAMRDILMEMKPENIEELGIALALVRPGAKDGGYREVYMRRRRGEEPIDYFDPSLEPVLKDTLGVFIYQEQVMEALVKFAGLSPEEADTFRRVLTKERGKNLIPVRERFFKQADKLGRKRIDEVWERIEVFTRYGFNKGHSMAYAHLAYKSMYSKIHTPLTFFKEVINARGGFYPYFAYVEEARRWGVPVLLPDINKSGYGFTIEGKNLRTGFSFIKFLQKKTIERIMERRPFHDFRMFLKEVSPETREVESLIKSGCFDSFGLSREEMFSILYSGERYKGKQNNHWLQELEVLSFTGRHPASYIERDISIGDIDGFCGDITIIGRVTARRFVWTRNGKRMGFFTIDDETGYLECVLFPDRIYYMPETGSICQVKGHFDGKNLVVNGVRTIHSGNKT